MIEPGHCTAAERQLHNARKALSALRQMELTHRHHAWQLDAALFELDAIIHNLREIAQDIEVHHA
jgi:DNA repair ATPase RecN